MKESTWNKFLYLLHTWELGEPDPNYDPTTDIQPQAIYRKHEFIETAEYLMSFQQALTEEFLKNQTLEEAANQNALNAFRPGDGRKSYGSQIVRTVTNDNQETFKNVDAWKNVLIKYTDSDSNLYQEIDPDFAKKNYPTAYKITKEFWDDCPIANYSYLAPNTVLHRHTGPENRTGEYIRIHIPLIIPPGDLFFEVNGEEIDWSDIFAFDNQLVHSAHNLSDGHRLIFLLDVKRSRIGLPPGQPFNKDRQLYQLSKPFIRKNK